jgi:hypothetical protein
LYDETAQIYHQLGNESPKLHSPFTLKSENICTYYLIFLVVPKKAFMPLIGCNRKTHGFFNRTKTIRIDEKRALLGRKLRVF